ncbi:hypothetical protein [Nocardioides sp.]|uniref:hypothetical protein n=1 Tax=Nocardioides sp. TaxID=35761 RepID=UPI002732DBED|nr:hypothetical protein [Nocardioides sp.]MDP3889837.1 hypothetical protein [Nocardioides sp.]
MIRVELQSVPDGAQDYQAVATITVDDDGTYQLEDPGQLFPTGLHALAAGEDGQLRQVTFDEDPATWARHLDTILRTGHLVPVTTHDTALEEHA